MNFGQRTNRTLLFLSMCLALIACQSESTRLSMQQANVVLENDFIRLHESRSSLLMRVRYNVYESGLKPSDTVYLNLANQVDSSAIAHEWQLNTLSQIGEEDLMKAKSRISRFGKALTSIIKEKANTDYSYYSYEPESYNTSDSLLNTINRNLLNYWANYVFTRDVISEANNHTSTSFCGFYTFNPHVASEARIIPEEEAFKGKLYLSINYSPLIHSILLNGKTHEKIFSPILIPPDSGLGKHTYEVKVKHYSRNHSMPKNESFAKSYTIRKKCP